jgi:hypothetical protein
MQVPSRNYFFPAIFSYVCFSHLLQALLYRSKGARKEAICGFALF